MIEEFLARYRMIEAEIEEPKARFRREYDELRALERITARLAQARRKLDLAASRVMPAR